MKKNLGGRPQKFAGGRFQSVFSFGIVDAARIVADRLGAYEALRAWLDRQPEPPESVVRELQRKAKAKKQAAKRTRKSGET